jgi:hypothetical protein
MYTDHEYGWGAIFTAIITGRDLAPQLRGTDR